MNTGSMLPGSIQEKYAPGFSNNIPSSQWNRPRTKSKYYVPFTARTPWLATVLIAVLACIAVMETAVQTGEKGGAKNDDDLDKRWLRRQETSTSSSTASTFSAVTSTSGSTDGTTSSTSKPPNPNFQTASSLFVTISTSSDDAASIVSDPNVYQTISTSSEQATSRSGSASAAFAPSTASNGDGGYVAISTSSESVMFAKPTSDFITVSTADDVSATPATSEYITILTTINSNGSPIAVIPVTFFSEGQVYTSYEMIDTDKVTAASAAPSDFQTITEGLLANPTQDPGQEPTQDHSQAPTRVPTTITTVTTLLDGSVKTLTITSSAPTPPPSAPTSSPSAPGEVKASQIQIGTTFTEMDYFSASYLAVLVAVILKSIWAMVFSSLKMMEPFFCLAKPGGAAAKDSLLTDFLSTGYSISHIKHIFSGHWVILLCTIAYIAFAILPPLATEASTVVATAYCTTPAGDQQPCSPVWVLNSSFVRGLEAVLGLIAFLIVILIFLSWHRKSGIFANPSSLASMASLLSHEDILHDLRQLDQSASNKQLAQALDENHYTFSSYETAPGSGLYRYGVCGTSSSAMSNPYSFDHFRNFDARSRTRYSALNAPSDYFLPTHYPSTMQTDYKNGPIKKSTVPFSIPKRTIRDMIFLAALVALLGVIVAYYLDGSSSGFNNFFNSHTFGPAFILTSAAVIIDFHWKTLEREVRILVPYRNLGDRMAKPETSVLLNIGGTAVENFPKALYRGEWFHALIAGTAILSDFLIVAVAGVPYSTAQVWQAFLTSAYVSMGILGVMILSMFGIFWWRESIRKLQMPREPDTLLSMWLMLCDEGNTLRAEFDGWETTGERERAKACRNRGAKYWGGWVQDQNGTGRWRWCVGVDGGGKEGMVVGYE